MQDHNDIPIIPTYTPLDAADALEGHLPLVGTDVEIVAYRTGQALCLTVNKRGIAAYRATITNAFDNLEPNPYPPLDPEAETFVLRSISYKT